MLIDSTPERYNCPMSLIDNEKPMPNSIFVKLFLLLANTMGVSCKKNLNLINHLQNTACRWLQNEIYDIYLPSTERLN